MQVYVSPATIGGAEGYYATCVADGMQGFGLRV